MQPLGWNSQPAPSGSLSLAGQPCGGSCVFWEWWGIPPLMGATGL